jgi:hypothetical protein
VYPVFIDANKYGELPGVPFCLNHQLKLISLVPISNKSAGSTLMCLFPAKSHELGEVLRVGDEFSAELFWNVLLPCERPTVFCTLAPLPMYD